MNWKGTALITGASAGLGAEFARQMAERGCNLILVARRRDRLEALAAAIQSRFRRKSVVVATDLATLAGIDDVMQELNARSVVPDFLVNNAGRGHFGPLLDTPPEVALQMVRLNIEALTLLTLRIGRRMAERGSGGILNVASTAAYQPVPYYGIYAATKAYVLSFSEAISAELSSQGVRVCTICPGPTATEFSEVAGVKEAAWTSLSSARECVRRSLNAYENGSITYIDGALNATGAFLSRFVPHAFLTRFMASSFRRGGD